MISHINFTESLAKDSVNTGPIRKSLHFYSKLTELSFQIVNLIGQSDLELINQFLPLVNL